MTILRTIGTTLLAWTLAAARWTWKATLWTLRMVWGLLTRAGRIALWVCVWPLGLWRSIRHGKKKDMARMEKMMASTNGSR